VKVLFSTVLLIFLSQTAFAQFSGSGRPGGPGGFGPVAESEISVRRILTTVGGRLEPGVRTVHNTPRSGLVDQIYVQEGTRVNAGEPLFSVVQDDPGNRFLPVVVEARHRGVVSEILIGRFDDVVGGQPAVVVADIDELILEAVASDLDAFSIRPGIDVIGSDPEGGNHPGLLDSVSAEPDYQTGLFTLTFLFPGNSDTRVGMPLFIDVPVQNVEGIFVPTDSVVRRYGRNRIWTVDESGLLQSVDVETGPVIDNSILIVSGLEEGVSYLRRPTGRGA
jgi:multidrug efflux pump subunit AcrA (membrane-fusion protein)